MEEKSAELQVVENQKSKLQTDVTKYKEDYEDMKV